MSRRLQADEAGITAAAECLSRGGVIVLPTETVYGIAARADSPEGIAALFRIKGRRTDKPVALAVAAVEDLLPLVGPLHGNASALAAAFLPGPLTIVLPAPRGAGLPPGLLGPDETIGIRIPDDPVLRAVARLSGPLALSSANPSGGPPPACADDVEPAVADAVDLILDSGNRASGVPSTVVALGGLGMKIIREGALSIEDIQAVVDLDPGIDMGSLKPRPSDI